MRSETVLRFPTTPFPWAAAAAAVLLTLPAAASLSAQAEPDQYRARLARPAPVVAVTIGGVEWSCEGVTCLAESARPLTNVKMCEVLASEVGRIVAFGPSGAAGLDAEELDLCNRAAGLDGGDGGADDAEETIERALGHTRRLRDALGELWALEEIERPKVTDRDALVEGRCVDANGQGVAGCSVFLVDAQGNRWRELDEVETGATGYFGLVAKGEKLEQLAETRAVHRVRFVVESANGDTIYDHSKSLELEPGARINLGNLLVPE